jgi:hypothetical protein
MGAKITGGEEVSVDARTGRVVMNHETNTQIGRRRARSWTDTSMMRYGSLSPQGRERCEYLVAVLYTREIEIFNASLERSE